MTSILDPALHTKDWVRQHSPFLFSAICAVATKVLYPSSYAPSFRFCNALFGQAFEHGINNVELVQALATQIFWCDATDPSGARKLAYAIRCAMDCGMHLQKKRPLPRDEYEARIVLSSERTWFYLTIADHRCGVRRVLYDSTALTPSTLSTASPINGPCTAKFPSPSDTTPFRGSSSMRISPAHQKPV